jgi:hypothetical protein
MLMAGWFEVRWQQSATNNLLRWQMTSGVSYKLKDKRGVWVQSCWMSKGLSWMRRSVKFWRIRWWVA